MTDHSPDHAERAAIDPAAIAAGLTKAQREALKVLPENFAMWPISVSKITIRRLVERGLLIAQRPKNGFGLVRHYWSAPGLAVRASLHDTVRTDSPAKDTDDGE